MAALFAAVLPTDTTKAATGIATSGVTAWTPVRGVATSQPSTITTNNVMVFSIPDNNFDFSNSSNRTFQQNVDWMNATAAIQSAVKIITPGGGDVSGCFTKTFVLYNGGAGANYGVEIRPIANQIGDSLELPHATTFGFSNAPSAYRLSYDMLVVQANTSSGSRATDISGDNVLGRDYSWVTRNGHMYYDNIEYLDDARQGDEYLIHFSPLFFNWSGDTPAKVTLSSIRSKISLRQSATNSSKIFEAVELASVKGEAVIRIKFKKPLATTHPIDFKTKIYLSVSGNRHEGSHLEIEGTLDDIDPQDFYSEERDIDISDGTVGIARETISRPKVYIGDGVTVNAASIRINSKFYGMATTTQISKYDEELLGLYPDIAEIYTLATVGLNGANATVDIDTYNGFYVYNADLKYLGRTTKNLEYSDKYYLAVKALNIIEEEDEYEPLDDDYTGKTSPSNPYDNPATGR